MATHASRQAVYMRNFRRWQFNWRFIWNLFVISSFVILMALGLRKLLAPQTLPIKRIQALGTFTHVDSGMLRQVVAKTIHGGYFTVNVDAVQRAVKAMPWVAHDTVRRVWPDTLAIQVTEQKAKAAWAKGGLVNTQGVLFFPTKTTYPKGLPVFDGPVGMQRNLTEVYQIADAIIAPLNLKIIEIHMDSRHSISLKLGNGIEVVVGREETQKRLERFARVYQKLLYERAADIARVDLRYSNGMAVGWRQQHSS